MRIKKTELPELIQIITFLETSIAERFCVPEKVYPTRHELEVDMVAVDGQSVMEAVSTLASECCANSSEIQCCYMCVKHRPRKWRVFGSRNE